MKQTNTKPLFEISMLAERAGGLLEALDIVAGDNLGVTGEAVFWALRETVQTLEALTEKLDAEAGADRKPQHLTSEGRKQIALDCADILDGLAEKLAGIPSRRPAPADDQSAGYVLDDGEPLAEFARRAQKMTPEQLDKISDDQTDAAQPPRR